MPLDPDGINLVIITLPEGINRIDARMLARAAVLQIAHALSTDTTLQLIESPTGPRLSDTRLQFSLSYAGNRLLIGLGPHQNLGVDLVKIDALPDIDALARLYLPAASRLALARTRENLRDGEFASFWAQMEACCKASGLPLAEISAARELVYGRCKLFACQPIDGYRIAVAVSQS
jgi:phosphopantetheinyl transferase